MAQQKLTRAAATVIMVLGVTVIGGSIAGGIALASGDRGGQAPAVSDPTEASGPADGGDATPTPGPADDRHGDETICEAGDDCGGMPTATAATDDDPDDDHGDDDDPDDDHDDDHDEDGDEEED